VRAVIAHRDGSGTGTGVVVDGLSSHVPLISSRSTGVHSRTTTSGVHVGSIVAFFMDDASRKSEASIGRASASSVPLPSLVRRHRSLGMDPTADSVDQESNSFVVLGRIGASIGDTLLVHELSRVNTATGKMVVSGTSFHANTEGGAASRPS